MLKIKDLSFAYQKKSVLKNISFNVTIGQNIALIGESGCGKSTMLKLIYGLYDLDYGIIEWKQKKILGPKYNLVPGMDFIKYVSQDFDLMPYITVSENIGKFLSNINKYKKQKRINELLDLVEMAEYANIKAQFLSGGQQQRVALARALAHEPEILLLDEPFSHIDNFRKNDLRRNLFSYLKNKNITCIVATHDSTDALSFADQAIVLKNGELIDQRNSIELYCEPISKYCASLFGEVNELQLSDLVPNIGQNKIIWLYPHQLKVVKKGVMQVTVKESYFKGNVYLIQALFNGNAVFFEHPTTLDQKETVFLDIDKNVT